MKYFILGFLSTFSMLLMADYMLKPKSTESKENEAKVFKAFIIWPCKNFLTKKSCMR